VVQETLSGILALMKNNNNSFLAIAALLTISLQAQAVPIVDGNIGAGEYSDSFTAGWYNGHNESGSAYQQAGNHTTTVYWENSGGFFYLGLASPLAAKSMIWGTGVSNAQALLAYEHWCSPNNGLPAEADGSNCGHHSNGLATFQASKTDYGTMTGSEKVIFGQGASGDLAGSASGSIYGAILDYMDSVDYVINSLGCDTTNCAASGVPMTFEFKFAAKTAAQIASLISDIQSNEVQYHLSPEMGPPTSVPEPSTLILFSLGLLGLGLASRRRRR
jgi:hypothetical protein